MELTICPVKRDLLAITRLARRNEEYSTWVSTGAAQLQAITPFKSLKFSKAEEKFMEVFAILMSLVLSRSLKSVCNLVH